MYSINQENSLRVEVMRIENEIAKLQSLLKEKQTMLKLVSKQQEKREQENADQNRQLKERNSGT